MKGPGKLDAMSCERMITRILPYIDGRLQENVSAELERHMTRCPSCRLRLNEFRVVAGLLDELPVIEP
jgi:anti-sigma factor RsiW